MPNEHITQVPFGSYVLVHVRGPEARLHLRPDPPPSILPWLHLLQVTAHDSFQ